MEMSKKDVVEVNYDAFLANHKTLENPEIIHVIPEKKVRLRIINGSSATNYFIHLGELEGEAIAVDGHRIKPLKGSLFELSVAQRIDILVKVPEEGGAFPILAQGEGTSMQTGVILATDTVSIPQLSSKTKEKAPALTNVQESKLRALNPLSDKPIDRKITLELGGDMKNYVWTLNGQAWPEVTPVVISKNERVEITFKNVSKMAHPMHLHGHVFQVTNIDGKSFSGAMRDTVLVMPNSELKIQFDANNPGVWPLHCHLLYHLEAGMFTVVRYKDYLQPLR
jgi:FtsP/CotA-like multicopper oxidase with cupredoxin domain